MSAEKIIKIEHENLSDSSGTTIVDSDTILQKKINKIFPKVDVTALLALRTEKNFDAGIKNLPHLETSQKSKEVISGRVDINVL